MYYNIQYFKSYLSHHYALNSVIYIYIYFKQNIYLHYL